VSAPALAVAVRRKAFGPNEVLRDVAFEVQLGDTLAVVGPSGVGKSTLLRIVAGLDASFEGEVRRPDRTAMVFQEPTLLPWRGALDNLTLTTGVDAAGAEAALAEVGLAGRGGLFPRQLSLGQQRRLALARAFARRPELLLLDEPYASLDPALVEEMLALTERLIAATRPATLFVTHSAAEAERLATRVLRLEPPGEAAAAAATYGGQKGG
jgi:ABC-type nitrate/sulfonate/bicarbonate transport system ATPase subunit